MTFQVECCDRRRGLLPGGGLICPSCDFDNDKATVIPNEPLVQDVSEGDTELTHVLMRVGGVQRCVGWVTDLNALPDLLEQVAAEIRAIKAEQR